MTEKPYGADVSIQIAGAKDGILLEHFRRSATGWRDSTVRLELIGVGDLQLTFPEASLLYNALDYILRERLG